MGGPKNLIALDADGVEGIRSLQALEAELGLVPETLTQRTGCGEHRIFRMPAGYSLPKNSAGRIAPKLDVRAEGGQIVVYPSVHYTGTPYEWINSECPIAELPRAWATRLTPQREPIQHTGNPQPNNSQSRQERYAQGALTSACDRIRSASEGTRNDTLNAEAYSIAQLVAGGALDREATWSALESAACLAGLADTEIRATLTSAFEAGSHVPRTAAQSRNTRSHSQRCSGTEAAGGRDPTPHYAMTDLGNSERLVKRHGSDLRFVHPWAKWLMWVDGRWAPDETAEAERRAKVTVRAMYAEASTISDDTERLALIKHAHRSEAAPKIAAMLKLATSDPEVSVRVDDLDRNRRILTVANGTLDLCTGNLRTHDRADLCTKRVPIKWNAQAPCPTWERFLADVTNGDQALIQFIQRAVGYTLTGDVSEQVLFFALGVGANGKSTFLRTIQALLGDYACQAAPDLLATKKGEVHPTEQADLFGKRLAVCTEIGAGRALAEVTVKQLTGGDLIKARRMREDFWEFHPTHKLWIAANHKPIVRGTDHAIWRRILLLPFDVVFRGERRDPAMPAKLAAELSGILRWAVEGCLEWQAEGLRPPAAVVDATTRYQREMDIVGQFLEDRCESDPIARTRTGELYEAYTTWCNHEGEKPVSQRAFGLAMNERGFERVQGHASKKYVGIRLRDPREDGDDGDQETDK